MRHRFLIKVLKSLWPLLWGAGSHGRVGAGGKVRPPGPAGGNQMPHEGSRRTAFSQGPVSPSSPRNSSPGATAPPQPSPLGTGLANPCLIPRRCPTGLIPLPPPQTIPDPEKGGMMMGSPPKRRLRVSSERSCGSGLFSPLLSPSPAAGRRAVWRGGLCAGPPRPEGQAPGARAPRRGRVSARPCLGKKARWARAPKVRGGSRPQLTPFPQPRGVLLYLPTLPGLPKAQRKGGWESALLHAR